MSGPLTLVTGATGFLGNNAVRLLLARGQPVRVLVRRDSDRLPLAGLDVERVEGDVRDETAVRRACMRVDRVVHAAAVVHIGSRGMAIARAVNVGGTRNVAAAATAVGARMVHVSTVDALGLGSWDHPADEETPLGGHPLIPYVITKREAEKVVLDWVGRGLTASIVNPGFMLGPWDWKPSSGKLLLAVGRGLALFAPKGCVGMCDARDVAAAIFVALQRGAPGRRYVTSGPAIHYKDAMRLFAEVTGRRPPWSPPGPVLFAVVGLAGDLLGYLTGREPELNYAAIRMARLPKVCSSARAAQELGYQTREFRKTVQDAWAWFREHGYA